MSACVVKAMRPCAPNAEASGLGELTRSPGYCSRVFEIVERIGPAETVDEVIALLQAAAQTMGADGAFFVSFIRDDATRASYRTLFACDPVWTALYAGENWFTDDLWLSHAMHATTPTCASKLTPQTPREQAFVEAATNTGFASALIAPAPSSAGLSRVGALILGSRQPSWFERDDGIKVSLLAQSLAMELHAWLHRRIKAELIAKARITEKDLVLLRHEAAHHSSKVIAVALQTEANTIDCRFQRLSYRLRAANRRDAVRIAKLYGLI